MPIISRANPSRHRCNAPWFQLFFSRFDEGDRWQCPKCGAIWTRYENYAGGGWQ